MGKDFQGKDLEKNIRNKTALIFFSAGIGDAVLMVPLLKKLRISGFHITIYLNSRFIDKEFIVFNQFHFDELIQIENTFQKFKIIKFLKHFDYAFLDYSSSSIKNILCAFFTSKKLIIHRKKPFSLPFSRFLEELPNSHAAVLNLQLFDEKFTDECFDPEMLKLRILHRDKPKIISEIEKSCKIPVFVQISSANMTAKYKNWPFEYWTEFIKQILNKYSDLNIILIGDRNEIEIGEQLNRSLGQLCINVIGKTNLSEACRLLYFSKFYIGLDSGFMHLAVAYGIPTFSIFGASSYDYFGYQKFSNKHKVIFNPVKCWPCLGYANIFSLKNKNYKNCQDFACLRGLSPNTVFSLFENFHKSAIST